MPRDLVSIRMYRGILGDCFLLTIKQGGGQRNVLIDCGVLQNVLSGPAAIAGLPPAVVQEIGE
jgi:hypothetical protein